MRAYLAKDIDFLDLNHQIYVPCRFVFGHFKERKEGFVLHNSGIYYAETADKEFENYTRHLQEKRYEIVRKFFIPNINLERLVQEAQTYLTAKQNIVKIVTPIDKYF